MPTIDTFIYDATLTSTPDSFIFKTTSLKLIQGSKESQFTFGPKQDTALGIRKLFVTIGSGDTNPNANKFATIPYVPVLINNNKCKVLTTTTNTVYQYPIGLDSLPY